MESQLLWIQETHSKDDERQPELPGLKPVQKLQSISNINKTASKKAHQFFIFGIYKTVIWQKHKMIEKCRNKYIYKYSLDPLKFAQLYLLQCYGIVQLHEGNIHPKIEMDSPDAHGRDHRGLAEVWERRFDWDIDELEDFEDHFLVFYLKKIICRLVREGVRNFDKQ